MRTVLRVILSIVLGFLLMWPLVAIYDWAELPTFHSWGLIHGSLFAAWPTLGAIIFFALGYVPFFGPSPDAPLRMAVLISSLPVYSFLNVPSYYSQTTQYGLLIAIAAIVAVLGFFAKRRLVLGLLALMPFAANQLELLPQLIMEPSAIDWSVEAFFAYRHLKLPILAAGVGWAIACLVARVLGRTPAVPA
ncbi:hypothetical protein ACQR1I_29610 [Bradyrhizobium sp. HKCCYLS2038]|uniref:hypothetical protein n=1 Tax=unclassified Bradyrhizobium TaxID=2631580 RepID=UPI003EBEC4B1